jgi:hypothetical protein
MGIIMYNYLTNKIPISLVIHKAMITMIDDGNNYELEHWASYSMVGVPHIQIFKFKY